ncbi:hypothetical protein Vi05172_g44 [Venturia inaequalis]|nr:hypothetical protein Vi05172_g44 [Venturia inaequalis]
MFRSWMDKGAQTIEATFEEVMIKLGPSARVGSL